MTLLFRKLFYRNISNNVIEILPNRIGNITELNSL